MFVIVKSIDVLTHFNFNVKKLFSEVASVAGAIKTILIN